MKVASKIVLVALLSFVPVLGVYGWFSLEREDRLFRSDMERDLSLLGAHLGKVVVAEWTRGGADGVASIVKAAAVANGDLNVEWSPSTGSEPLREHGLSARRRSLVWFEPVRIDGRYLGEIVLEESLAPMHAYLRATVLRFGVLTALLIAASVLAVHVLSRRLVGRRLETLVGFAARTGAGDLGKSVDVGGRDEIAALASSLGAMSEQLAEARRREEHTNAERFFMLQQLRHADRLASLGRLAAAVAHELGTPLNVVMGHADRIADGAHALPDTKKSAATIHRQVKRMEATIRDILGFVRKVPGKEEVVDLREVAETVSSLLRPLANQKQITIEVNPGQLANRINGYRLPLEQALSNVVANAVDASPPGGRVRITITREQRTGRAGGQARPSVLMRVRDEGPGISKEEIERLFEPFYTSKPTGHGTGLGLWLADGIIRDHGGSIELENPTEKGACFAIVFPEAKTSDSNGPNPDR